MAFDLRRGIAGLDAFTNDAKKDAPPKVGGAVLFCLVVVFFCRTFAAGRVRMVLAEALVATFLAMSDAARGLGCDALAADVAAVVVAGGTDEKRVRVASACGGRDGVGLALALTPKMLANETRLDGVGTRVVFLFFLRSGLLWLADPSEFSLSSGSATCSCSTAEAAGVGAGATAGVSSAMLWPAADVVPSRGGGVLDRLRSRPVASALSTRLRFGFVDGCRR